MRDCFDIRRPLHSLFPSKLEEVHRLLRVPTTTIVVRQFSRNLTRVLTIALLFARTDLSMQALPPRRRHLLVQHILIQGVQKAVARRHGPIGPCSRASRLQKLRLPHEGRAALLDMLSACSNSAMPVED